MIEFSVKECFFDRAAVKNAVDRATLGVLSKIGAYIRQAAKSSIRTRKEISKPGNPPSSHEGSLKRLIFFSYDPASRSVVIGPVPLRGVAEAPPLLEFGGTARRARFGKARTLNYRPRPFMAPAMQQELPKLSSLWAGSVKA
jgi:hypothetical protein